MAPAPAPTGGWSRAPAGPWSSARSRITPHPHATPARSFWEVNTASHVDYPHHARLIELTDNGDRTVSLFTTLVESAAPHRTARDFDDLSAVGLASLYREVAYNAPGLAESMKGGVQEGWAGGAGDRNTELVVTGGPAVG